MFRPRPLRLMLGLVYVTLIVGLFALDVDPIAGREWIRASGPVGLVAFVVAFSLLQPVGMASHLFIVSAAVIWEPPVALMASWLGALGASSVAFGFARYVGRDWVQARMPQRLRKYDEGLAQRGFRTVLVMRLLLFTFGPMQLLFGVSRVRFAPFLAASAIGLLPMMVAETLLGGTVVEWLLG